MNKLLSIAASATMLASALVTAPAMAAPGMGGPGMNHNDPGKQQMYVMNWCKSHSGDPSCRDFNNHNHRWSDAQYHNWYSSHRNNGGFDPAAAAIFGFTALAIGSAIANSADNNGAHLTRHQRACFAKYGDAYNARTDMYKYPGRRARECDI